MASLCVDHLHCDVTESMLLKLFNFFGRVSSIRLCRNESTGAALQHAIIDFQQRADAERAVELLNHATLLGQSMCIRWHQKVNKGNIIIRNLEESIDSLSLNDVFSTFGNVLSCKVVCDEQGSKGLVHFERPEGAEAAIKRLDGMLFNDQKVHITHFDSCEQCQGEKKNPVTTVLAAQPAVGETAVTSAVPAVGEMAVKYAILVGKITVPAAALSEELPTKKSEVLYKNTKPSLDTQNAVPAPSQKPLTFYMLESADVDEQISMLNDHIFPLVEKIHLIRAKDITNMILQGHNNNDLLNMIGDSELLRIEVEQIAAMLRAREAGQDVGFPRKNKRTGKKRLI